MKFVCLCSAACLLALSCSCQLLGGRQAARDVEVKVFPSDLAKDVRQLWVVDAATGERLEPLVEGSSLSYKARFSPSKAWLAVEDKVTHSFTTVRLFQHSGLGGFRRIPDEQFMPVAWGRFRAEQGIQTEAVASSACRIDGWARDESSVDIVFSATLQDGRGVSGTVPIDLDRLP